LLVNQVFTRRRRGWLRIGAGLFRKAVIADSEGNTITFGENLSATG
jgi:hypothetical protein